MYNKQALAVTRISSVILVDYIYCSAGNIRTLHNFHLHITDLNCCAIIRGRAIQISFLRIHFDERRALGWGQNEIRQCGKPFKVKRPSTPGKRGQN